MVRTTHTPAIGERARAATPAVPARQAVVTSAELLRGEKEIVIAHRGEHYRLRQTSNGKLILTK